MPFAITPTCCNDASCVSVCPVNCIHPTPDEPEFGATETLYVDPDACIDCGACADACPVDAVFPIESLRGADAGFAESNRQWFVEHPTDHSWSEPDFARSLPVGSDDKPLRIAVVGAGPAAGYTIRHLLHATDARITLIDRLPVPGGLLRSGVAPDHPATKQIGEGFGEIYRHPRVRLALNVEVGRDVSVAELADAHSAVVYAFGASADRRLGVAGEQLANSLAATDVVGWYNGHPDRTDLPVDLRSERAVVVGTGNVALDLARVLLADPDDLARTDISDVALAALRTSRVREVVLLGRRDASTAAFTAGEFAALRAVPDLEIVLDRAGGGDASLADGAPPTGPLHGLTVVDVAYDTPPPAGRRLVLRFGSPVAALDGEDVVTAVRTSGDAATSIPAGLVIRSIGYRGRALPGLPFDTATGVVPNDAGRVLDPATGAPLPGAYVAGWIKRGPSGGIGTNRADAAETVHALLDDVTAGRLPTPGRSAGAFLRLLYSRTDVVDQARARAIDAAERRAGEPSGRPRVKFVRIEQMLAVDRPRAAARAAVALAAGTVADAVDRFPDIRRFPDVRRFPNLRRFPDLSRPSA